MHRASTPFASHNHSSRQFATMPNVSPSGDHVALDHDFASGTGTSTMPVTCSATSKVTTTGSPRRAIITHRSPLEFHAWTPPDNSYPAAGSGFANKSHSDEPSTAQARNTFRRTPPSTAVRIAVAHLPLGCIRESVTWAPFCTNERGIGNTSAG